MNGFRDDKLTVFTEVIQLPVRERAAYLDRACGADLELRRAVEVLLQEFDQLGDFLEKSPNGPKAKAKIEAAGTEKPGDRIGSFKLLQQIGEGGCGVVFMAEQSDPVHRTVALKIIKPGMDTKSVIARFEAERQALALMNHPSIAKIFDAGATQSGRPYFVMELVRGIKITEYCDQHSLSTEDRLKLFIQVCQAIQHAHQKGIIHRDIKPSNILVTSTEAGAPLPVVIDFGIAKATTNQRLTDKTLFTAFEMLIGTPAYMSPEQAAFTSVDVDTRTDVYSLGVLLYELLTGSTPFDTETLLKSGLDEIRRVIREEDPVRPSARLSRMNGESLTVVARHHGFEPPRLIRTISGDLDWIVMKALEKDRTRRYESADSLAEDIKRFLSDEAVLARPPTTFYRFQKTMQRHRLLFAAMGVVAIFLVVSLILVSASLAKEQQSRREAKQVKQFLEDMLQGVGPNVALGRDTTVLREILDQAAAQVGKELTNQPAVEAELRSVIGTLYYRTGQLPPAEEMLRKALAIRRNRFGPESPEAAASLDELGLTLMASGKLSEAEQVNREALSIRLRCFGNNNADVATSQNNLALVYSQNGKFTEGEVLARQALATRQKLFGNESLDSADSLRTLAIILGDKAQWHEAETKAREVLEVRRKRLGPEHPWVAAALDDVAWAAAADGKQKEAEVLERESLAMRQRLLSPEHPDVAKSLYLVGDRMRQEGNLKEAYPVLSAALSIQSKVLGKDHPSTLYTMKSLGLMFEAEHNWPEAEMVFRETLAAWRKRVGNEDLQTIYALRDLADSAEYQDKWSEAEALHREELIAWRRRVGNDDPQTLYTLDRLASALEGVGKWLEAESAYREALASQRKQKGNGDPQTLSEYENLAKLLMYENKFDETEQLLAEALTPAVIAQPSSCNLLLRRQELTGRQGRWQEAVTASSIIVGHQPTNQFRYHTLATLLAISQNRPAYEICCRKILATFTNTSDPYVCERVAKDCLFLPDSGVDLEFVDKLADKAVSLGSSHPDAMPYFQTAKAMAAYRGGRFTEAIAWSEKTLKGTIVYPNAHAYAILAMANWQLGRKDTARVMLAKGDTLTPKILPARKGVDLGDFWLAWLEARISLDEAGQLIQPDIASEVK